eukprot:10038395-Ditylum_brightwellii.AAC.1
MVDLSIPGYILVVLTRFKHKWPSRDEYAPHEYEIPRYTRGPQMAQIVEDLPQIPPEWKTRIQQVLGTLLFYARPVDPTMLLA